MSEKNPTLKMTTPKGVAVYPHLHAPDTKFDADGVYSTKLTLSAEDAQPIIDKLEELRESFRDKARELAKGKKVKEADFPFQENEDGTFTFNFKMKAKGKRKDNTEFTRAPTIFDATNTPRPGLKVGGGSILRVAFVASPFWTALVGLGVTLRLEAVQVVKLETFGSRDAGSFGFGAEEGGFAGEGGEFAGTEETSETPAGANEETEGGDGDSDF